MYIYSTIGELPVGEVSEFGRKVACESKRHLMFAYVTRAPAMHRRDGTYSNVALTCHAQCPPCAKVILL